MESLKKTLSTKLSELTFAKALVVDLEKQIDVLKKALEIVDPKAYREMESESPKNFHLIFSHDLIPKSLKNPSILKDDKEDESETKRRKKGSSNNTALSFLYWRDKEEISLDALSDHFTQMNDAMDRSQLRNVMWNMKLKGWVEEGAQQGFYKITEEGKRYFLNDVKSLATKILANHKANNK